MQKNECGVIAVLESRGWRFPPNMMAAWDDQYYKRTAMEGEMFSFVTKLFCETKLTCISVHYAGIGGRIFTNRRWLHAFFFLLEWIE
eukprot:scaffold105046_cov55-Cyclotella_meneghiniana.AAC.1